MSGVQTIEVTRDEDEMRVDRWFKKHFPHVSSLTLLLEVRGIN